MEFEYRRERLTGEKEILRPVAKAYLQRRGGEWVPEYFYVDSGADYSLLPFRMGLFFGFNVEASDIQDIEGLGGSLKVAMVRILVRLDNHQFECRFAWAQLEEVPLLLGRQDVFDNFEITFQQRKGKTIFSWVGD